MADSGTEHHGVAVEDLKNKFAALETTTAPAQPYAPVPQPKYTCVCPASCLPNPTSMQNGTGHSPKCLMGEPKAQYQPQQASNVTQVKTPVVSGELEGYAFWRDLRQGCSKMMSAAAVEHTDWSSIVDSVNRRALHLCTGMRSKPVWAMEKGFSGYKAPPAANKPTFKLETDAVRTILEQTAAKADAPAKTDLGKLIAGGELSTLDGVTLDSEGHVTVIRYVGRGMRGALPEVFCNLPRLQEFDLGSNQLTGTIPDFSKNAQLSLVYLSRNNLTGNIPDFTKNKQLKKLNIERNEDLAGNITSELVLQCSSLSYSGCKARWAKGKKNDEWMSGPFIVGASFASEDITALLWNRDKFGITDDMLKNPPSKGDKRYPMYATHGGDWVAWQDVWLEGLAVMKDRDVFVVTGKGDNCFDRKFKKATTDDINKSNCFDATYQIPGGERTNCILDWERRQVALWAEKNNLRIYCIGGVGAYQGDKQAKPAWYPLPDGFVQEKDAEGNTYHVWKK